MLTEDTGTESFLPNLIHHYWWITLFPELWMALKKINLLWRNPEHYVQPEGQWSSSTATGKWDFDNNSDIIFFLWLQLPGILWHFNNEKLDLNRIS